MGKAKKCVTAVFTLLVSVHAADWPQFCGPDRNNISSETGLARSWPEGGPKEVWSADVTEGYAGPAIKDGKVYFLEHEDEVSSVRCLALDSGKELWRVEFDDPGGLSNKRYPGTRGTPTVTGDALYAVTLFGKAVCVDLESHKIKWQLNLEDRGRESQKYGFAQSPEVHENRVFFAPLSKENSVFAVDKDTGEVVWKLSDHPGGGFASPILLPLAGEDQLVVMLGGERAPKKRRRRRQAEESEQPEGPKKLRPTHVIGVSPKDGKVLWSYDGWSCHNPIPHPILVDEDTIFITAGYESVSMLLRIEKGADGYTVEELMKTEDAATWIEQPVFINNHLFVGGNSKSSKNGLVCIDLQGTVKWDTNEIDSAPKFDHLNMIAADNMLIGLDGDSGMLHLIEALPKGFNELSSAKVVAEKGQTWSPIALSDGKLVVRDHHVMKCLDLK